MQIGLGILSSGSGAALNVAGINQGLRDRTVAKPDDDNNDKKYDRVSLSPQGKLMNMIENLNKQREAVIKQKSELVAQTMENGKPLKSIEVQLELYEQQLTNIDEQIAQATAEMAKTAMDPEDDKKEKKSADKAETKTEEQAKTEQLSKLASAADNLTQAKTLSSLQNKAEGEIRVNDAEIRFGEIRIDILESYDKLAGAQNPGAGFEPNSQIKNIRKEMKENRAANSELRETIENISSMMSDKLSEAGKKLEENRTENAEKPSTSPENPAVPNTGETTQPDDKRPVDTEATNSNATANSGEELQQDTPAVTE